MASFGLVEGTSLNHDRPTNARSPKAPIRYNLRGQSNLACKFFNLVPLKDRAYFVPCRCVQKLKPEITLTS